MTDIRWKQRFENYIKALESLTRGIEMAQSRQLNELEQQGLIQGFEFTHELAWNVLKDYLTFDGHNDITGSRSATRLAFKHGLILNGNDWMEMIKVRNLSSHTYNLDLVNQIVTDIITIFHPAFIQMRESFIKKSHHGET